MTTTHAPPEHLNGWGPDTAESVGSPDPQEAPDPAAPFGYTTKGQPRKSRAGRPRKGSTSSGGPQSGPKAPPRTSGSSGRASGAAKAKAEEQARYAAVAGGLVQGVAVGLMFTSPLDGLALTLHGAELAEAVGQVAPEVPWIRAAMDRLGPIGPAGPLVAVALKLGAQIGANHGWLPPGLMGSVEPHTLAAMFQFPTQAPAPAGDSHDAAAGTQPAAA